MDPSKIKSPCFFISPHLDDAVFSAGGLMIFLAKKNPVTVVNVFTEAGDLPYTLSAKKYLSVCEVDDARKLFEQRRNEDQKVLEKVGVKVVNLGFVDALWRKKEGVARFKIIPEFANVYATFRLGIARGKISIYDQSLVKNLKKKLSGLVTNNAIIFCPLGIGKHVDHIIVRDVCSQAFAKLIYWSDFPYLLTNSFDREFVGKNTSATFVFAKNKKEKEVMIKGYKSQLRLTFPKNKIELVDERYYYA